MSSVSASILFNATSPDVPVRGSPAPRTAWRELGWFGLLIAIVGLIDLAVNWYPVRFGSPEWEFGTIAGTMGSLPLMTIGLAALLASLLARGRRWGVMTTAVVLLVLGAALVALMAIFALDVPLALKAAAHSPAGPALRKTIIRTGLLGLVFSLGYLAAGVGSVVSTKRRVTL